MIRWVLALAVTVGTVVACRHALCLPVAAETKPEAEIRNLLGVLDAAHIPGDAAVFDRIWADDYFLITAGGETKTKRQALAEWISHDLVFTAYSSDEARIRVYDSVAVVTGRISESGSYKGVSFSGRYRYTRIFVKRGGKWQLVVVQRTGTM